MLAEANTVGAAWGAEDVRILRLPDVVQKTGLSKSDIYGRIRRQEFPAPVQIGPRSVGFVEQEVNNYLNRLIEVNRIHVGGVRT